VLLKLPPAPTALACFSTGKESISASSKGTKVEVDPESIKPIDVRD